MSPDVTTSVSTTLIWSASNLVSPRLLLSETLPSLESSGVYSPSHPTPSAVIKTPEIPGFFRFLIP
jgi:hypothetical protein